MTDLAVDPAQYAGAATQFGRVGSDANGSVSKLAGALSGSSGMAGSDNAGVAWGHSYDDAARAALSAAANAVNGAGQVSLLLHASGANHANADATSTIGGGDGSLPPAPAPVKASSPNVPSAAGGSGSGPPGWSLVAHLVGYAWPNGHQDRLHAAQAAWSAAAAGLRAAAGPVSAGVAQVQSQQSPEVPAAVAACGQVGSSLTELASVCTDVGQSCGEYAAHLDHAHHEILSELKTLLIETAAIEVGGAVLAFFTAGIDEIAAQAAVAARIAKAAAKIRSIIEALIEAARVVATALGRVAPRAAEVAKDLEPLEAAGAKRAEAAVARDVVGAGAGDASSAATESLAIDIPAPREGMPVWRVYGEAQDSFGGLQRGSMPGGQSWTPRDPRLSTDFRADAGLPDENPGRFIVEGRLADPSAITSIRPALPLDGQPGGWPEYLIENAEDAVVIDRVQGVNLPWTRMPGDWVP